jgi:hydrogenase maturation protease
MTVNRGNPPASVSILGLGNVLLGDDAFGSVAVEMFRCAYECGPEVEIVDLGTPGLDLAPYLYEKDLVVIVDAVNVDRQPGTVLTFRETDFLDGQAQIRTSDHDPGLQESLAHLRIAGHAPVELIVVGVVPESCSFGATVSRTVLEAFSAALDMMATLLEQRAVSCRRRIVPSAPKLWWLSDYRPDFALAGSDVDSDANHEGFCASSQAVRS